VLYGFLLHDHRRADRRVFEKRFGHPRGQTDAAVRRRVGRDITLVHGVAAAEKHRIRHSRAIVMAAGGSAVLPGIDIRFHHVPRIVDVIAEDGGDMVLVFRKDRVVSGRRGKSRFAGGDSGFTDEGFTLIKIGMLLGDADDDFGRTGDAVAVPVSCRRWGRHGRG